jgi:hypothetical protein
MVCLIGEQPAPNLIPILHYRPAVVVPVYSERTHSVACNLEKTLESNSDYKPEIHRLEVEHPFSIELTRDKLRSLIESKGWLARAEAGSEQSEQLVFNLTGGTKPMSLAAYDLARELRDCKLVYFQTEDRRSLCYEYIYDPASDSFQPRPEPVEIDGVLTIDMYLKAHGHTAWREDPAPPEQQLATDRGRRFERHIAEALKPYVDELRLSLRDQSHRTLEVDLMVRYKNQIAVIEVKQGRSAKKLEGLSHLVMCTSQTYLGSYVGRILVLGCETEDGIKQLADALGVPIVVLSSFTRGDTPEARISPEDQRALVNTVCKVLGRQDCL